MRPDAYNLAIETSSHHGAVTLGRGSTPLVDAELPRKRRHNLELVPTIAAVCEQHGIAPADLAELYVSLGPGSFTGLRIAIATAKMLALTIPGLKIVGVPTLDIVRAQHPEAMVCLNVKRDSAWSAGPGYDPALRSIEELHATGLPLVADTLEGATPVQPTPRVAWSCGRAMAAAGQFTDPYELEPLYIREPEAVTLWNEREARLQAKA